MNDQKSNDIIKPISTELDDGDNKLYKFESNQTKSFTFENGKLKEHNEHTTVSQGNEHGSVSKTTEKNTQFQKPLPPTPNDNNNNNNNNNNKENHNNNNNNNKKDKPITNIKTTTTYNNYDNNTVTTNTSTSKTPYNTPNQQYQSIEEANSNPVDFGKFKDSISKLKNPKKSGNNDSTKVPLQDSTATNDPEREVADNLGLHHLNKNPNVGPEQYFTGGFSKYAAQQKKGEPLPETKK